MTHGIRHYACSDAWEPPEGETNVRCYLGAEEVDFKLPESPTAYIRTDQFVHLDDNR